MGRVLRSLNRLGIDEFRAYLSRLRETGNAEPPRALLDDTAYSHELPVELVIEDRAFSDRYELGRYLAERLGPLRSDTTDHDVGLWAWLSLAMFNQVCPIDGDGKRYPGQDYRHIPDFGYRHRHRHLLLGPFQLYRRHGVTSLLLLSSLVHSESGVYHEIASRQDLIANKGVLDAALMLYLDPKRGRPKAGAQGSLHQPGTVRRFVRVLQQLDVTYDIYGLSGRQLLELLPPEFDMWQPQRAMDLDVRVRGRPQAGLNPDAR
jgi:hypothetical protein